VVCDRIVSVERRSSPLLEPGLFAGRPWVVYYEGAVRDSGRRAKRGMISFETEAHALAWLEGLGEVRQ